jgi:hypothetical protein
VVRELNLYLCLNPCPETWILLFPNPKDKKKLSQSAKVKNQRSKVKVKTFDKHIKLVTGLIASVLF